MYPDSYIFVELTNGSCSGSSSLKEPGTKSSEDIDKFSIGLLIVSFKVLIISQ